MPRMGAFITNLGSLQPVVEQKAQEKTEDWLEEHVIIPEGGAVTLDPTLTTANQAAEAKATGDAIAAAVSSLNNQITAKADMIINSASGSVASFTDGADGDLPMQSVVCNIEPVQSGDGDPSPTNIRPISGLTGLTLSHSGADTSNPTTLSVDWTSTAGTVYGGSLDVTTGVLTVDRVIVDLGTLTWSYSSVHQVFFSSAISDLIADESYSGEIVCEMYAPQVAPWHLVSNKHISIQRGLIVSGRSSIVIKDTDYNETSTFKTALSGVHAVYKGKNAITYQLSPTEVTTLLGDNNVWCDTGDTIVSYPADTKLYIDNAIATLQALVLES